MVTKDFKIMEKQIKAIETEYKGYLFRSRTEARWAIYFDALGVKWEYEYDGYHLEGESGYLPDFYFPKYDAFGEVKPSNFEKDDRHRAFVEQSGKFLLLFIGPPSDEDNILMWKEADGDVRTIEGRAFMDQVFLKYGIMYFGTMVSADVGPLDYAIRKAKQARFEHGAKNEIIPFFLL